MIRHYGIMVKDLKRAVEFYKNLFGFKEIVRENLGKKFVKNVFNINNYNLTYVKLQYRKDVLELYFFEPELYYYSFNHIAFTVQNVDKVYRNLEYTKANNIIKPFYNKSKTCKLMFCRDFEGNLLELVEEIKNE